MADHGSELCSGEMSGGVVDVGCREARGHSCVLNAAETHHIKPHGAEESRQYHSGVIERQGGSALDGQAAADKGSVEVEMRMR